MLKSLLIFSLMLISPTEAWLQTDGRQAELVHRYESGCGYTCNQELAIDLGGVYGNQPDDVVAVRLCSRLPMPKASAVAASPSGYVFYILTDAYHYTPDRLLFLRSEDCLSSQSSAATEYWVIPKGAPLPPHIEAIKSCQIGYDSLKSEESLPGERNYKSELQNLVEKLRTNQNAVGIILGYYIEYPSRSLKSRMLESQKYMERSGLSPDRYLIHIIHWTGEFSIDPPEPKPKYPTVFAVEVKRDCQK